MRTHHSITRIKELPLYYRTDAKGFTLVAIISAKSEEDPENMSYYSVPSLQGGRISPVFLFDSSRIHPLAGEGGIFCFDSEYDRIKQEVGENQKEIRHQLLKVVTAAPFVLFFKGGDDSHVGRRFVSEEEAFSYLESLSVFEDVFKEEEKLEFQN